MHDNYLDLYERPALRRPHLLMAFGGWPDAAEVATGALRYVVAKTNAPHLGTISVDPFYDFSVLRPAISAEEGQLKLLRMPSNDLYYHIDENGEHDFIFLLAIEPHLRWETFVRQIMELVDQFEVSRVIILGSMFDAVPHTKEAALSGMAGDESLRSLLRDNGLTLISYQGPSSVHTLVQQLCQEQNTECVSLWGHVPLYVRAPANPQVCWAMLNKITLVTPLQLDLSDLQTASENLALTLNRLLNENTAIRLYVRRLEEQFQGNSTTEALSDEGARQMIQEVEDFLRREHRRRDEFTDSN